MFYFTYNCDGLQSGVINKILLAVLQMIAGFMGKSKFREQVFHD